MTNTLVGIGNPKSDFALTSLFLFRLIVEIGQLESVRRLLIATDV